ncbi:hypothetical protein B6U67_04835 [Methanosarcinales archaeon ex4484_138]|nr:MAG: hypothetical protein B6U67_04835 [Methanosarcinales archaeon ex4484_138]
MYEVIFDLEALVFFEKSDKKLVKWIWNKIMSTKSDLHHFFERLVGEKITNYELEITGQWQTPLKRYKIKDY